jgi:hypothetical protein
MTAELIQFERHRDFRRGELFRQQPVPRAPSQSAKPCSPVELQVARISRLLSELEELTRESEDVPVATLNQARLGVERARSVIRPWKTFDEIEGDPQPEVDDERLERMYRDLNRDA